jgi:hypothetical protein
MERLYPIAGFRQEHLSIYRAVDPRELEAF